MIKYRKISEICKIFSGNSINEKIKKEKYSKGKDGIEYISTKDIGYDLKIDYKNGVKIPQGDLDKFRIAPPNTVFICAEGGSAGRKLAISDRQLCFVNKLFAIVSSEKVLPKFIFYFIQSENFNKQFKSAITGLIGGVSLNKFKEFEIPILPILDQERIVAKLDKIFAEIDKALTSTINNLKNLELLFISHLNSIFNNGNTVLLKNICEINMGQSPSGETYNDIGKGVPLINGPVEFSKDAFGKTIKSKFTTKPTKMCKEGDLILCVRGSTTGRMNIAGFDSCIGRGVASIRAKDSQKWINYFIFANKDLIYGLGKGSTFPNISSLSISNLKIFNPPFVEKKKILFSLDIIKKNSDNLKIVCIQKIKQLNFLKQSILQQAFNGKLVKAA